SINSLISNQPIERRLSVNSIRSMTASLAVVVALTTSANIQAQSAPRTYTPPAEPGISSIATKQQQDEVMTLMAAYLGLWLAEDPSRYAFEQFVTEDAVFEYPYADEAFRRIEGRKAIGQALRKLPVTASNWRFTDLKLYQTLYPHIFFVEYTAKAHVPTTQRIYESRHLARVTVRDGKIADYNELWERDAKAAAFGTIAEADCVSSATAHEAMN
ncbi:MAG: nuclear transport factor 2 family protein, partial [Gemmatimonadaceae bacterium]